MIQMFHVKHRKVDKMSREAFIKAFDSEFINLVTEKWAVDYNLGYTGGLLAMALVSGIIDLQEYTFLADARFAVV